MSDTGSTITHSLASRTLPRFDADFIERGLRQHREWQQQKMAEDATEIILEVSAAIVHEAQMRAGKGPHKIARLK